MKDALQQLLRAEEAGRRSAASREAEGRRLIEEADAESERIAEHGRQDLSRRIEALGKEIRADTDEQRRALAEDNERSIESCREQSARRRSEAVGRLVALLLEEPTAPKANAERGSSGPPGS